MEPTCPVCHTVVRPSDYYCFNCGKNLHEKPLSTSKLTEYAYYIASVLVPPLGFWWGIKYLRQADPVSKRIGIVSMVLTVIASIVVTMWSMQLVQDISGQVNQQMQGFEGL